MSKPTKYDRIQTEFVITKSPAAGRYHFKAKYCKYLNYLNGTPEEIANHIGKHMAETMRGMDINNATEIKINISTGYNLPQTEIVITKSPAAGKYFHYKKEYKKYQWLSLSRSFKGKPNEIANQIGKHMEETMLSMDVNNAAEIKIEMSWK